MERLNSGDSRIIFGTISFIVNVGRMKSGRVQWQEAEETRKDVQYCTDPSRKEILHLRALQGHSGRNLIDLSSQDNVLTIERFLQAHLSHRMCDQFAFHHKFRSDTAKSSKKTDSIPAAFESCEQET